jgi:histidine ammonia-lyase
MANKLENFVIALGNMDIAVMLRMDRFNNTFFTVVSASDVLQGGPWWDGGYTPVALQQEIQTLMNPVAPFGAAIVSTVEDLQTQTLIKAQRARQAVATTMDLLAYDMLGGALWMDVRKKQDAAREFGKAPTAAWTALRKVVPLQSMFAGTRTESDEARAGKFMWATDPGTFYPDALPASAADATAAAGKRCGPAIRH